MKLSAFCESCKAVTPTIHLNMDVDIATGNVVNITVCSVCTSATKREYVLTAKKDVTLSKVV